MDLNSISQQIQYLPDAQLAAAVKNPNGVMPQYLALAELSRRQKIRASAPQQQPQGTVADDVLHSLRSAGIQPQQPMQQGAPMPQQMGIAQAQPQQQAPGMARGGLVQRYGGGGAVDGEDEDDDSDLQEQDEAPDTSPASAGIASSLVNPALGAPAVPQIPAYNPKQVSYQDAATAMRAAYGPGQDYSEELNGIRQLRNGMHAPNGQDLSRLQGLYTMASKDPMGGLAEASLAAHKDYDGQQQQYYKNMMENYGSTFKLKSTVEERNDKIADSIRDYWKASNLFGIQMANGQEKAAKDQAGVVQKAYKDANDAAKSSTYPEALRHLAQAQQALGLAKTPEEKSQAQAVVDVYKPVVDGFKEEKRTEEEARLTQATRVANINASSRLKAAEISANGGGVGVEPDGSGHDSITTAAINWITTEKTGVQGIGKNAFAFQKRAMEEAQKIMKERGITPEMLPQIRSNYLANKASLADLQKQYGGISGFERNVEAQLEPIAEAAKAVYTTKSEWLNKVLVPAQKLNSKSGAATYTGFIRTASDEYGKVMGGYKGATSDQARAHAEQLLNDALSKGNLMETLDTMWRDMQFRLNGMQQEIGDAGGRMNLDSLVEQAKTGRYPASTGKATSPDVGHWPGLEKYGKGAKSAQPIATPTAAPAQPKATTTIVQPADNKKPHLVFDPASGTLKPK